MGLPPEIVELTVGVAELIPDRRKRRHSWPVVVAAIVAMVGLSVGLLWLMQ